MRRYPKNLFTESGLALITVLVFLQIFAILALYNIRSSLWQLQQTRHYAERYHRLTAAEACLKNAEASIPDSVQLCLIPATTASKLRIQPLLWWQSQSCTGNFNIFHYYYVVESLGTDNCAEVNNHFVASYYRITLLLDTSDKLAGKVILQSSYVVPVESHPVCHGTHHPVAEGRQFWHEII